jgi:hypothetical protein
MQSSENLRPITAYLKAIEALGPKWVLARAILVLLKRSGVLERRSPLRQWNELSLNRILNDGVPHQAESYLKWRLDHSPNFLFHDQLQLRSFGTGTDKSIQSADRIMRGEFPFFGYTIDSGSPPHWRQNPLTHAPSPDAHWSAIDESQLDDIKLWWELNRFSWVFSLARAYIRTPDERYPETFWSLLECWMSQNPPNCGVNWVCGQEASIRVMALCFGFYVFLRSKHTTSERVSQMLAIMAAHAERINAFHEYAHSQKNNHGISEGVGLWTIGLLFPELRHSFQWKKRGRRIIELEVRRQVYADGSYIQHSTNYHRVFLQYLAWAMRLAACNSEAFDADVDRSFRGALHFLYGLTDPHSGRAPNYGANDGALVLPLSDCSFADMRPALQACYFLAEEKHVYPPGPWDEEMLLLNGPEAYGHFLPAEVWPVPELTADCGGYYTLRSDSSWAMLRGVEYKDRPSHADQLHLDLWWRGENVLCDSGSYSYNAKPPFDNGYASTRYHNTVTIDGRDQMTRVSRFLWADWAHASVSRSAKRGGLQVLQGVHFGYRKLGVIHRRAVTCVEDRVWVVVDDLSGHGHHIARLHWQAPDVPYCQIDPATVDLTIGTACMSLRVLSSVMLQSDIVRAGCQIAGPVSNPIDPARGWISSLYGRKEPSISIAFHASSELPVRFLTVITLGTTCNIQIDPSLRLVHVGSSRLLLSDVGEPQTIHGIQ